MMKREQRGPRMRPDGFEPGMTGTRFAQMQPASYDAEAHTVEAILSTGYRRRWFGIAEELLIAPEAIDLTRVPLGQVRLLDTHNQYSVEAVLGVLVEAWITNGTLYGRIKFGETAAAREAEGQVARGEVRGISVGYRVLTWAMIGTDNDIEIWQAQRWELFEVSLCAVPADPHAGIRSDAVNRADAHNEELDDMRRNAAAGGQPANPVTPPATTPAPADPACAAAPATSAARAVPGADQVQADLARTRGTQPATPPTDTVRAALATLTAAFASAPAAPAAPAAASAGEDAIRAERLRIFEVGDIGRRAGIPQADIDVAVRDGVSAEQFRTRAFDAVLQRSTQAPTNPLAPAQPAGGQDEAETRRRGMRDAIVARLERASALSGREVQIPEHARAYGEMGFAEMAAECIGHRGPLRTARQVIDVVQRSFHSTSDFPGILVDAINRRLLARYQAARATYRLFAALYTATDFRPTNVLRMGDFPALQEVKETGEIKAGTFSESKEIFRVYPYGVKFNLSRQMIVNDQMRAIDQMLGSAGDRVLDWENAKAFTRLVEGSGAGPTLLTDNKRVFHADHGNYTSSSGAAPSITTLGVGRAAMMKQTSLDGMKLNLTPATILTSPDKLTEAEQLTVTITPAASGNAVPDWIRRLVPAGDANLTGNAWYLFADPSVAPCFVYGYLEGFEGPRLRSEEQFGVQGLAVSLEHDFGIEAVDFRGGYRNIGQ